MKPMSHTGAAEIPSQRDEIYALQLGIAALNVQEQRHVQESKEASRRTDMLHSEALAAH